MSNGSAYANELNPAVRTSATLGLLGSFVVFGLYLMGDKRSRMNYSRQCIVMVCLMEILPNFGRLWGTDAYSDKSTCNFQASMVILEVGESVWNIAHATNIMLRIIFEWNSQKADKLKYPFLALTILLQLLGISIGLGSDTLRPSGGAWCGTTSVPLLFGTKHAWILFAMFYETFIAIWVWIVIKQKKAALENYDKEEKSIKKKEYKAAMNQLWYVPAFMISIGYSTPLRLSQFFVAKIPYGAFLAQAILVPLQSFWFAIIYTTLNGLMQKSYRRVMGYKLDDSRQGSSLSTDKIAPKWYAMEEYL